MQFSVRKSRFSAQQIFRGLNEILCRSNTRVTSTKSTSCKRNCYQDVRTSTKATGFLASPKSKSEKKPSRLIDSSQKSFWTQPYKLKVETNEKPRVFYIHDSAQSTSCGSIRDHCVRNCLCGFHGCRSDALSVR